jgi:multiple sugar transport system permease protein
MAVSLRARRALRVARVTAYLSIYGVILLFPMYWMFVTALEGPTITVKTPPDLYPKEPTLANFRDLFRKSAILRWTLNTFVVASVSTVLYALTSTMAGYAFSKKVFPGRDLIFWIYVSTLMIPYFTTVVPMYVLVSRLKLLNTFAGLILPVIAGPFGSFLMKQYIASVPSELIQAAKIDGCSEFGAFLRILIPLAKPGITFLGIVTFILQWNNFLWPLLATSSSEMRVLQVGIALFSLEYIIDYGLTMAAAAFATLPVFVLFFVFQKHIVKGIAVGALKG